MFKVTFLRFSRTYKNFGCAKNGGLNIDLESKMAAFVNKIQLLYDAIMAFLSSVLSNLPEGVNNISVIKKLK